MPPPIGYPYGWPDDPGQDGLLMIAVRGQQQAGITQKSTMADHEAYKAALASTIATSLNNTSLGTVPKISLNPMGL